MRRLIIRPGAIGDTIVSLPALEQLCPLGSGVAYAEIWAPERNRPLLAHLAPVRSIAAMQLDLLELSRPPALVQRLRGFDEIVSWYGAAREEFRAALEATGVPFRLFRAIPPEGADCHAVDFYLRQVGAAAGAIPRIPVPAAAPERPYIAIQPFSGSPKKNWPLARFRAVASALERRTGLTIEWCAGPDETLPGARRFKGLDEVARWLSAASLYIGNDSGITHLAAACGVPVVAIFTVTDAKIWSPRGERVHVLQSPEPRDVAEAALGILSQPAKLTNLYIH